MGKNLQIVVDISEATRTLLSDAAGPCAGASALESLAVSFRTRNVHTLEVGNFPSALPALEKHLPAQKIIAAVFVIAET